jgi:membrane associated rhomboid family serine protease
LFEGVLNRFQSVTALLIWVNVGFYAVKILTGFFERGLLASWLGLSVEGLRHWWVWQPVTYMFMHDDLLHILFNMLILWFLGREVEYFIGARAYAKLYFIGGLVGAALWLAFNLNSNGLLLGASAAVLACVIAFATLFPNREITLLLFFFIPVTIKAKYLAIGIVALDIIPVLEQAQTNIAHLAHIGGAAIGYIFIKHLGYGATPGWLRVAQSVSNTVSAPLRRTTHGKTRKPTKNLSPEDFMRTKVDPILDKINREGIESLTDDERRILDQARSIIDKKTNR